MKDIISKFDIGAEVVNYKAFGSGHINDTYLIEAHHQIEGVKRYLLQRINHHVFRNVEGLMQNMHVVTTHLAEKLSQEDKQFTTVHLIPSTESKLFYEDNRGNFWRVQSFVPNSISYDLVKTEGQAHEAGYAFGKFQNLIEDIDVERVCETIPDFHNMAFRFKNFENAIASDPVGRRPSVNKEINFAEQRKVAMLALYQQVAQQKVPIRITHNDTKFNNVLLDQHSQKAICVIDLDTVMPGVVWYDFGDAVRTIISTSEEDEPVLDKIDIQLSLYEAFTAAYLEQTAPILTPLEVSHLSYAAQYMTFIMGLRFLTDYISGDVYYKIKHPEHNLERARSQFRLVQKMEDKHEEMQHIVDKLYHQALAK